MVTWGGARRRRKNPLTFPAQVELVEPRVLLSSIPVAAPTSDDSASAAQDWNAAVSAQAGESLDGFLSTATFDCALNGTHTNIVVADSTISDSWTDDAGGTTTVNNAVLSTLTTTVTCNPDGSSSFVETLTSSYTFLTVYVSPGPLNYTTHTWGFYNYTLNGSSSGDSIGTAAASAGLSGSTAYTLDVDGSDSYSFARTDSVTTLGIDNSTSIDSYSYTTLGTDSYTSYYDTSTTYASDGSSTIVELALGSGTGSATYAGAGAYSWTLAVGDVTTGDGRLETYDDAYIETWWDNYDYNYLDVLTTTVATDGTKMSVGSIHDDGFGDGGQTYWWEASANYTDAMPELDSYSELAIFDHWIESWTDNYDYDYDETTTYFADGSETFAINNFGGADGTYSYLGDGTYDWLFESGDLTTGDGVEESYHDTYIESFLSNYDDAYHDILTYAWAADGTLLLTGTIHADGFGDGGETYWWDGSSSWDDAVTDTDSYSELATFDHWTESWTDNFDYDYDETITFLADGSVIFDADNFGGGDGTYLYLGDGTYDWWYESGDFSLGDGLENDYADQYLITAWENYDYGYDDNYTDTLTSDGVLTTVGSMHSEGFGDGGSTFWMESTSAWDIASPETDSQRDLSTFDHRIESGTDNFAYAYNDTATYYSDGSLSLTVDDSGSGYGTYSFDGDGTYDASYQAGDLTLGDGVDITFADQYLVSLWDNYNYGYLDNYTATWSATDELTTTGFINDWGGGAGGSTLSTAGSFDYADAVSDDGTVPDTDYYSEWTISDTWNGFVFDNYLYSYNDLVTFNSDGSRSVSVINSGSGNGGSTWSGSGSSSYFEDYNTSPWRAVTDDSHVYDVSGWASYGYSYNDSLLSTTAADGTTTIAGFIHDEGSADGESTLLEHTFESFEEWVTELDASSHTYDETDTDRTTIATLDEDIDRTDSFFADGTISTVDNSTSNSGSTTTETVLAAGFWSVTFQGATTSGSYGTLTNPSSSAYLLAFGSSGSSGSGTIYANSTDSSAALGLAVQQSGLSVTAPTAESIRVLAELTELGRAEWLSTLSITHRATGEPNLAHALAGDYPAWYSDYFSRVISWGAPQPPVNGLDSVISGTRKTAVVVGGVFGAGAAGLGIGVAVGIPGAAGLAATPITAVGVGVFALKEAGEYIFETATGIPVIVSPDDIAEWLTKGLLKRGAKEGTVELTEAGVKHVDDLANAAKGVMGNAELGGVIRSVAGKNVSAAEKARLLSEGASKVKGVTFNRIPDIPGAEAVFKGEARASDGKSPILVVLKDGRVFRGFDDALIPDPSGATTGLRILLSSLVELK